MKDDVDEVIDNLKVVYPRFEDETYFDYIMRAIAALKAIYGFNVTFLKIWKYHDGNHISKSHVFGFETLWIIAIGRLLYYESVSI